MLFCSHIGCKLTLIIVLFALLYYKLSLTLSMYKVYLTHHCFCDFEHYRPRDGPPPPRRDHMPPPSRGPPRGPPGEPPRGPPPRER